MNDNKITVEIPEKHYNFLKKLSETLLSQDNRATQHPIYLVFEVTDVVIDDDYSPSVGGHDIETRYIYTDPENTDSGTIELDDVDDYIKDQKENYDEIIDIDSLTKLRVAEIPNFVNAHLTDEGAKLYIKQNKHNLNKPYTYVNSFYRCHDMIDLREFLLEFKDVKVKG